MLEFKSRKLVAPAPRKNDKVAVNLSLPIKTRDDIDRLTAEGGFSHRSQFITEVIKMLSEEQ